MKRTNTLVDKVQVAMDSSNYEGAAAIALKGAGATMTIKEGSGKPCPFGGSRMGHYRFTITTQRGRYSSDFWQSIAKTAAGKVPTAYDVLACLQWYTHEDNVVDFANAYGYTNGKEAQRTFNACKRQSAALGRIFTEQQIDALSRIG